MAVDQNTSHANTITRFYDKVEQLVAELKQLKSELEQEKSVSQQ
jgi:hypothetical protein